MPKARKRQATRSQAPASARVPKQPSPAKRKPRQRRAKAQTAPPVIVLPPSAEPLARREIDLAAWSALVPRLPPEQALPRSRALVVPRRENLLNALADWLGSRTQAMLRRLSQPAPVQRGRARPPSLPVEDELQRLRTENERLRLQLEALLALQTGAGERKTAAPA